MHLNLKKDESQEQDKRKTVLNKTEKEILSP